jgi:hypothetical protein
MATHNDVAQKLNSYKRSNGQRMFYVTDQGSIIDEVKVNGNEVTGYVLPENGKADTSYPLATFTLGVNCFRMIRTRKVETTETWTLDE